VITLRNGTGAFGTAQDTISAPGADDGIYRVIDMVSDQGTFTALRIKTWESIEVKFKVTDFFVDLSPRNFIQDVGEPTLTACSDLALGTYAIYVKYVSYRDDDNTGSFTAGDTIHAVDTDRPYYFDLTDDPYISQIKPKQCANRSRLRLLGINLGDGQTDGEVRMGKKSDAVDPALGKGNLLDRIKDWNNSKVIVKLKVPAKWEGKNKYVWVEKDGKKSNYKKVEILTPSP
jgi:hypothetical protein